MPCLYKAKEFDYSIAQKAKNVNTYFCFKFKSVV